jgi:hypothetical protein
MAKKNALWYDVLDEMVFGKPKHTREQLALDLREWTDKATDFSNAGDSDIVYDAAVRMHKQLLGTKWESKKDKNFETLRGADNIVKNIIDDIEFVHSDSIKVFYETGDGQYFKEYFEEQDEPNY